MMFNGIEKGENQKNREKFHFVRLQSHIFAANAKKQCIIDTAHRVCLRI